MKWQLPFRINQFTTWTSNWSNRYNSRNTRSSESLIPDSYESDSVTFESSLTIKRVVPHFL